MNDNIDNADKTQEELDALLNLIMSRFVIDDDEYVLNNLGILLHPRNCSRDVIKGLIDYGNLFKDTWISIAVYLIDSYTNLSGQPLIGLKDYLELKELLKIIIPVLPLEYLKDEAVFNGMYLDMYDVIELHPDVNDAFVAEVSQKVEVSKATDFLIACDNVITKIISKIKLFWYGL